MFRFLDERLGWGATALMGALPLLAVVALASFLAANGVMALSHVPIAEWLSMEWLPFHQDYGTLPLLAGTLVTTLFALAIAAPIGLFAALYLALFAGPRFRRHADALVALLGGMPSVIIGLWGITWLVPLFGNSLISATLVLAVMITPTFTLLAGAAFRQTPPDLIETVRALGSSDWLIARVVMGHAASGLVGAAILATCRGLGEAVALSMVAGNVPGMPALTGPISTLTTTLIIEFDGATGHHRDALYLLAVMVMGLIAVVSAAARFAREGRPI